MTVYKLVVLSRPGASPLLWAWLTEGLGGTVNPQCHPYRQQVTHGSCFGSCWRGGGSSSNGGVLVNFLHQGDISAFEKSGSLALGSRDGRVWAHFGDIVAKQAPSFYS